MGVKQFITKPKFYKIYSSQNRFTKNDCHSTLIYTSIVQEWAVQVSVLVSNTGWVVRLVG